MSFEIKLPLFEGPFDLLLFFIERDELDIYDIPIAKITNDFLDYLNHLESLNIEVASEFMWVAASLMRIKARTLLPRPELDQEGNEIDPRDELVQHLLEYKKYKSVINKLADMEEGWLDKDPRGNVKSEVRELTDSLDVETELQHIDLYKLLKVFTKVMGRFEVEQQRPSHEVVRYPYTISQQKSYLLNLLKNDRQLAFSQIIAQAPEKMWVIFSFLAILELLQLKQITIILGEGFNNFHIKELKLETQSNT
ncbi:segregation and condensation protein A [Xanthovirga aplysinae]|uniref:segregation and condensation protein A n=1 Tax=Xanthovirga aplysinae TaxID=2529853 RepID=UPI0012BC3036|nr:segregation/condensation protein A [Xanthovirga aplysinae]MTI30701.1 chromosome segregation protein ScpA [Xanthovirga aplysinae]